ncbi:hypothetical protein BEL05_01650 [Shewanella colwelliana]|uniref:Uncharacterized protein n=1 Tax=Shewanella colwelliana TaxID=23 RepID=A0A1E5IWM1_SHECO|nr:hypothetical protein BEL05_01650 [Shewanella colwelliana]
MAGQSKDYLQLQLLNVPAGLEAYHTLNAPKWSGFLCCGYDIKQKKTAFPVALEIRSLSHIALFTLSNFANLPVCQKIGK